MQTPATKQAQRSGGDSSVFEISFRGDHTCAAGDRRRIPTPPRKERTTSPETGSLVSVSGDLQPSSAFSFPSICGPGRDIGCLKLCRSGSEMAEIFSGTTSAASESLVGNLDSGLAEFDFDAEFQLLSIRIGTMCMKLYIAYTNMFTIFFLNLEIILSILDMYIHMYIFIFIINY